MSLETDGYCGVSAAVHRLDAEQERCFRKDAADLGVILYLLRVPRMLDYSSTQRLYFVQICQLSQVLRFDYLHRGARVVLLRGRERPPQTDTSNLGSISA